jgi:hypothetical protein
MDPKEIELEPADLIPLALNWSTCQFLANKETDHLVLQNAAYLLIKLPIIKFSRRALVYGDSFVTECNAYRAHNVSVTE